MKSKGMFYTLGLTLFVLVLLSLAILFFQHASQVESRQIELGFTQKVYDVDQSVKSVLVDAFQSTTTFSVAAATNSVTISQNLLQSYATFQNLVQDIKNISENSFNLDLQSADFFSNRRLVINNNNNSIIYSNNNSGEVLISANPTIAGYAVTILPSAAITSCQPNLVTGGALNFSLWAVFQASNCMLSEASVTSGTVDLWINSKLISFVISESGQLSINTSASEESSLTIFFDELQQKPKVFLPIPVVINEPSFTFTKTSYPVVD
jgi:hypothetical protein